MRAFLIRARRNPSKKAWSKTRNKTRKKIRRKIRRKIGKKIRRKAWVKNRISQELIPKIETIV